MRLPECDEEAEEGEAALVASLRHVLQQHRVQGQQLLQDVQQLGGVPGQATCQGLLHN